MNKHGFLTLDEIQQSLSFSVAPSILGEPKPAKGKEAGERFEFMPCYNKAGDFIGLEIDKVPNK